MDTQHLPEPIFSEDSEYTTLSDSDSAFADDSDLDLDYDHPSAPHSPVSPPTHAVHSDEYDAYDEISSSAPEDSDLDDANETIAIPDAGYDSAYSTPSSNATTTIASLVTNYKFEHGRRYHSYSEGLYFAPNDTKAMSQLEIFHHIHRHLLDGGLFLSPVAETLKVPGSRVLDLGTGTGTWAIALAEEYPDCEVLGNDLSPVQPTWVPGNCTFEVDDFTKPWLHGRGVFDFVFCRSLAGSVRDWRRFFEECRESLVPGGWVESVECTVWFWDRAAEATGEWGDGEGRREVELSEESKLGRLMREVNRAAEMGERGFDCVGRMGEHMKEAGFGEIQQSVWDMPVGPWMQVPSPILRCFSAGCFRGFLVR